MLIFLFSPNRTSVWKYNPPVESKLGLILSDSSIITDLFCSINRDNSVSFLLPDAVVGVCVTVCVTHEPLPMQPAHDGFQSQPVVQRFDSGAC